LRGGAFGGQQCEIDLQQRTEAFMAVVQDCKAHWQHLAQIGLAALQPSDTGGITSRQVRLRLLDVSRYGGVTAADELRFLLDDREKPIHDLRQKQEQLLCVSGASHGSDFLCRRPGWRLEVLSASQGRIESQIRAFRNPPGAGRRSILRLQGGEWRSAAQAVAADVVREASPCVHLTLGPNASDDCLQGDAHGVVIRSSCRCAADCAWETRRLTLQQRGLERRPIRQAKTCLTPHAGAAPTTPVDWIRRSASRAPDPSGGAIRLPANALWILENAADIENIRGRWPRMVNAE
jgi:hypothetical protein